MSEMAKSVGFKVKFDINNYGEYSRRKKCLIIMHFWEMKTKTLRSLYLRYWMQYVLKVQWCKRCIPVTYPSFWVDV